MKQAVIANTGCPWGQQLHFYETVDSTNTQAKVLAKAGAPHGTVLLSAGQTGGRGRMGRQFVSPPGMGVYLSVVLRPQCPPAQLMHLTCAAAVAMCDAVEAVTGFRPGLKWINDLVGNGRKIGGILTELSVDTATGLTEYAVIGIGINCCQQLQDFPPELQTLAGSLAMVTGQPVSIAVLAGAMIDSLYRMSQELFDKASLLCRYRRDCITLGKQVVIHGQDGPIQGLATAVSEDGELCVTLPDGATVTVSSGEVSVRGLYGYI